MEFPPIELKTILEELVELQAEALDELAVAVIAQLKESVRFLSSLQRPPKVKELADALRADAKFLDVCRLFLGVSQETAAHRISTALPEARSWTQLRALASRDPTLLAQALANIGLPEIIGQEVTKKWTVQDVLLDRYKMSRGRAIAGQLRGRALETAVEAVLRGIAPFESRVTFVGRENRTAKCDIAIPGRNHPKIVIEAKGFEATGSKLTDFLGDIVKIIEAKESRTYFFVVTDGRGWLHRKSDLKHVVDRQHQKYVDMIYTSARLDDLARDVRQIWHRER